MKVDQDFSAAIFNADFEKAARLIVSGKNMNGVSSKETALQLARQKRSDVVALLRCGRARLLSLDAQIVR
jgi:translation initiation factor IF-3